MASRAAPLKVDPASSFKMKSMVEGGADGVASPTTTPLLKHANPGARSREEAASVSMASMRMFVTGIFLAFVLGAAVTSVSMLAASGALHFGQGPAYKFAAGSCVEEVNGAYTCSNGPLISSEPLHGRQLAATIPCNQFNVAVSPTTFQKSTKSGDTTVGIWQATITNQCAAGALTDLVVSTNGRYNPAGGDPRSQTNLQNCSPPTVNLKTGQTNGPVTCQVVLPGGMLGAGQSMVITYTDNFLNGSPPQFTYAVSSAVYGTPVAATPAPTSTSTPTPTPTTTTSAPTSTPSPTPTHSTPTTFVPCNQFNVAVSPTTFVGPTKSGDTVVGIWQATITNQCAAGKVTNLVVSTNGRYNPAGGDPRSQTNLQKCSPPTVNLKTGQTNGPVTCQAVLPNGSLGAGQSMTISYVDNYLSGSPPQFSFAASTAAYAPN